MFQSPSIKPNNNTIIWNNNNINGNININNNYSSENLNIMNPIKRTGSFKNNNNSISAQNYSNHFKQIKLGNIPNNTNTNNINKIKSKIKFKKNNMESNYNTKTEGNKNEIEVTHAKNYINYLYEHLDTSYNANSELSNKTEMIINMKKDIELEIKRNNDVYKSLILSYNDKLKMNNKYKNEFINFLNLYKKQYKTFNNESNKKNKELNDLILKNNELKKEIKNTEEIINYLKKTENILNENDKLITKDDEEKNEMELLKKELMKLKEIKDNENKFLEKIKNTKVKEKIDKVKKDKNNSINNIKNVNNKVRNKKFIIGGNKFKKNSLDYNNNYKKLKINNDDENENGNENKYKDCLSQQNSEKKEKEKEKEILKTQQQESNPELEDYKEKIEKEEKEEKKEEENEEIKEIEIDTVKIKEKKKLNNKKKKSKKKSKLKEKEKEIEIEEEIIIKKPKRKKKKSKVKETNNSPEKEINEDEEVNEIKEYELSDDISDNISKKITKKKSKKENTENPEEKKEKIMAPLSPNLSIDELSSIKSPSKTQKKLSQSQESILDILTAPLKGSYLYTITPKGKLLSFNINHKKFALIDSSIIDGWTSFISNYLKNIEGSLLLNTLEGLFIITGNNYSDLYFYSQEKSLIAKITTFKYGHKYGGLLLSPSPDNNLFVIGGDCPNNEVELLSFEDDQNKSMPNLLTKRINASYTFINYKLYAIFGEDNDTIEYLNIKKLKNNWNKIDYKMSEGKISNIYGHVSLPVQDNNILIVGGKNNKKMMVLDLDEKTLDITDMNIPFIDTFGDYIFDKEKFFNQTVNEENKGKDGKSIKQLIGMDSFGNIHLFDYNFNYVVILIKNQKNNNIENHNDKEK